MTYRYAPRYTPINEPLTAPGKPPIPDPKPDPFPGPPGEEPCEVASSIRITATELRALIQAKQLLHQELYNNPGTLQVLSANRDAFFKNLVEMVKLCKQSAFIPPHMLKDMDVPSKPEVGFGPPLPQPDTAKLAKRRGKLHKGHAAFEVTLAIAACNATLRYDGRPTTHIPFRKP